jgi:predicted O-methyltransferase YrrM
MNVDEIAQWSDGVWSLNHSGVGPTYTYNERYRLTQAAMHNVPNGGIIVEVGVYAGSSLSCLLQVARKKDATVYAVDPFVYNGAEAEKHLREVLCQFPDVNWRLYPTTSDVACQGLEHAQGLAAGIDLIHIDGDHFDVAKDCRLWFPHLKSGGIAVFHDCIPDQRSNIYQVYLDVVEATKGWEILFWAKDENCQILLRKP